MPSMNRPGDRSKPVVPYRTKKSDLQVDARKAFAFTQACRVSRSNRGVRNIAENTSVDRARRVPVSRHICNDFECRAPVAGVNEIEPEGICDRWWVLESTIEVPTSDRKYPRVRSH